MSKKIKEEEEDFDENALIALLKIMIGKDNDTLLKSADLVKKVNSEKDDIRQDDEVGVVMGGVSAENNTAYIVTFTSDLVRFAKSLLNKDEVIKAQGLFTFVIETKLEKI